MSSRPQRDVKKQNYRKLHSSGKSEGVEVLSDLGKPPNIAMSKRVKVGKQIEPVAPKHLIVQILRSYEKVCEYLG